jgi:hypothetical protein
MFLKQHLREKILQAKIGYMVPSTKLIDMTILDFREFLYLLLDTIDINT